MIDSKIAQSTLNQLSYYSGPLDGNLQSDASVTAIKLFQRDLNLGIDGVIGEKQTSPALLRYAGKLAQAPINYKQARRWRMTFYYVENESDYDAGDIPVYDSNKNILAKVSARLFAMMSLEGTARLKDGRLLNVAGSWVAADADVYEPVRLFAARNNWIGKKYGYAGLVVENDRVTKTMAFHEVPKDKTGLGYGITHGIPLEPFKTVAADIGAYTSSEPLFRGKGGLVPVGTKVFILELVGLQLPDGTTHDGWVTSSDTGGAIYGAHFDLFVGGRSLVSKAALPGRSHIWYEGIEDRIPASYAYGL